MRRLALATLVALGMFATGCPQSTYGDASVDAPPLPPHTFDVNPTTGDAAPPTCDGNLYAYASQGMALCSHASEVCVANTSPSNTVVCNCSAPDGGMGHWDCTQQ